MPPISPVSPVMSAHLNVPYDIDIPDGSAGGGIPEHHLEQEKGQEDTGQEQEDRSQDDMGNDDTKMIEVSKARGQGMPADSDPILLMITCLSMYSCSKLVTSF